MQTREWHFDGLNKALWGIGPWQEEPDKKQWTDKATGLPCLILRNVFGALCGYVGVPEGHPFHGRELEDIEDLPYAHGGINFCGACDEDAREYGICHLTDSGEPDNVWWFGFDCARAHDYAPRTGMYLPELLSAHTVYRTISYVETECTCFARDLARIR